MKTRLTIAALVLLTVVLPVRAGENRVTVDVSGRPFLGPEDAPVTIIEFLDFQ
jgi:hypothetical protein